MNGKDWGTLQRLSTPLFGLIVIEGILLLNTRVLKRQFAHIESQEPPVRVEFAINQPKAAKIYYNTCGKINHHNRRRHDTLRLERKVETNDWSKQFNQSILGMIVDNTFLWYNQLVDESEKEGNFYLRLAEELINN